MVHCTIFIYSSSPKACFVLCTLKHNIQNKFSWQNPVEHGADCHEFKWQCLQSGMVECTLLPRDNIVIFVCVLYIRTAFHGLPSTGLAFQYYSEKATWAAWHLEGVHSKWAIVALKYAEIFRAIKKCYVFRALQHTLGFKIFMKECAVTLIRPVCVTLIQEPPSSTSFGMYFLHTTTIKYNSCGHDCFFNVT